MEEHEISVRGGPEDEDEEVGGVCGAEAFFMAGEEMHTCLRVDAQCTRENRALVGLLAQGNARMVREADPRGRTLARATVRLLGDTRCVAQCAARRRHEGDVPGAVEPNENERHGVGGQVCEDLRLRG